VPRAWKHFALVALTGLGWGLLAPATKVLIAAEPSVFDGTTVAVARAAWSFPLFLIGLALAWRLDPPRLDARRWALVVAAGLVFGLVVSVVYIVAAQHTSVAHIAFLVGISPVTNTAVAAVVFRTGLERRGWTSLALGIAGVALLAAARGGGSGELLGDALMLVWLAGFAAYACLLRAVGAGMSSALLMCLVGAISMASVAIPGLALTGPAAAMHVLDAPATVWWFFGEIVVGSTLVAQTTYAAAVRRMGVAAATIGAEYTALFVGVVWSLAAREPWTPLSVLAGLVFCAALAATFTPLPFFARDAGRDRALPAAS